jgi:hypothetical protein
MRAALVPPLILPLGGAGARVGVAPHTPATEIDAEPYRETLDMTNPQEAVDRNSDGGQADNLEPVPYVSARLDVWLVEPSVACHLGKDVTVFGVAYRRLDPQWLTWLSVRARRLEQAVATGRVSKQAVHTAHTALATWRVLVIWAEKKWGAVDVSIDEYAPPCVVETSAWPNTLPQVSSLNLGRKRDVSNPGKRTVRRRTRSVEVNEA